MAQGESLFCQQTSHAEKQSTLRSFKDKPPHYTDLSYARITHLRYSLNETQSVITQADSILHLRNTILMMKMKLRIVIGRGGKSKSNQSKVCTDLPNDYFDFQSC